MGTACPARPLREKFSSGWHCLRRLLGGGGLQAAGARRGDGTGPWQARRGHLRAGAHVPFEAESQPAQPGALVVSPLLRAGFLSGATPPAGRQWEGPAPLGGEVEPPPTPSPRLPAGPPTPTQARGELRSNLAELAAGCAGLYLGLGRGPGSPARGCRALQAVPPPRAQPLRPVPRRRPAAPAGEEPRPRPVPPRPRGTAPGSPPRGLGRCVTPRRGPPAAPARPLSGVGVGVGGWQCGGGGPREEASGSGSSGRPQPPTPAVGRPDRQPGSLQNPPGELVEGAESQPPPPPRSRCRRPGRGSGICVSNWCPGSWRRGRLRSQKLLCTTDRAVMWGGGWRPREAREPALGGSEYLIFATCIHPQILGEAPVRHAAGAGLCREKGCPLSDWYSLSTCAMPGAV